ncbi:MAG: AMP-binding protein, partial [Planctomycetota bacterium]|nr:AMP-binding protein [Planctomycetota bacterium]
MTAEGSSQIDNVMQESRLFPPTPEFVAKAKINSADAYQTLYDASIQDTEAFWGKLAEEELHWFRPFETVYEKTENGVGWFVEGQTNISYNCLDAQIEAGRGDKVAFIWEGEPGDHQQLTYRELHREVCRMANGLKKLGIEQGDRVSIYMPMTPELPVAMLACARIGAIHSVIFGGFSAEAIAERNNDAEAKLIITADGGWRRGKVLPLKNIVDQALSKSPSIESCLVLRRTENDIQMQAGRDVWMHELLAEVVEDCPATPLDAETPLFILYPSGSTGKPNGIKHTTAGYSLYTKMSFQWVF